MSEADMHILVVDDDDVTAEVVDRALAKGGCAFRVVTARDGQDGLDVLRGKTNRRVARPYIILLDLNMPRMNGFEFLEALRHDQALRDAVVFVLSTSDSDNDRARAYNAQIAGYMIKSEIGPQFGRLAAMLREYAAAIRLPR